MNDDQLFLATALKRLLISPDEAGEISKSLGIGRSAAELAVDRRLMTPEQAGQVSAEARIAAPNAPADAAQLLTIDHVSNDEPVQLVDRGDSHNVPLETSGRINDVPRFRLVRKLGEGGMGRVWQARDEHVDRDVAVKEMLRADKASVEQLRQFWREAQITGGLEHPGIAPVHELGMKPDGTPFYVMKFVEGHTLTKAINAYHRTPKRSAEYTLAFHRLLNAFIDVCNAMDFAHSRKVLHRDLKPSNVMLGRFGEAIVVDWGLAKRLDGGRTSLGGAFSTVEAAAEDTAADGTSAGAIKGTPNYMAPEQAAGDVDQLTARTDVYALGAILYEILCGRQAFSGENKLALLAEVRAGRFVSPRAVKSDVPRALEAVCLKAMALKPAARYPSARMLRDDIECWRSGEPVAAYREPIYVRAQRWARKHRTFCISALTAVALSVVGWLIYGGIESSRLSALENRVEESLRNGRQALLENRLEDAGREAAAARSAAADESELSDQRQAADELRRTIDERVADRDARRRSQETLAAFRAAYDESLYYALLSNGADQADELRRGSQESSNALRLVGTDVVSPSRPQLDERYYSTEEIAEIGQKSRELLVVHAGGLAATAGSDHAGESAADALRLLDVAESWGPPMKSLYLRRAEYCRLADRPAAAAAAFEQARVIPPQESADFFLLGEAAYGDGRYAEAGDYLQQALRIDPSNFWAQYLLALCQVRLGGFNEAIALLDACQTRRPSFLGAFIVRGFIAGARGDLESALEEFRRAEELDTKGTAAFDLAMNRGVARLRNNLAAEAIEDFRIAAALRPASAAPLVNVAEALHALKRDDEALVELADALKVDSTSSLIYLSRARLHNAAGRLNDAMADFDHVISRESNTILSAQAMIEKGRLLHRQKSYDAAVKAYDHALKARPDYLDALYLRALVLIDLNRDTEAIADLSDYIERGDLVARAHQRTDRERVMDSLSLAANEQKRLDPSRAEPRRLLASLYRERGLALMKTGDERAALRDFAAATALIDDAAKLPVEYDRNRFALMYSRRGWALILHGDRMAADEFSAAISAGSPNGEPYAGRGFAYVRLGRVQEAISDAEQAATLGPAHPEHYHNIACIYAQAFSRAESLDAPADIKNEADRFVTLTVDFLRRAIHAAPVNQRPSILRHSLSDPALEPVTKQPRFQEFVKSVLGS